MSLTLIILCVIFLGFYAVLWFFKRQRKSFNYRVLNALFAGLLFGGAIQLILGIDGINHDVIDEFSQFISVFARGYVKLLQMLVIPLVFVAMVSSIMNVDSQDVLSRIAPKVIGFLILTVSISALVGVASIYLFGIDAHTIADSIGSNSAVEARGAALMKAKTSMLDGGLAHLVLSIIPANLFDMLTGSQRTSTLSTVLFSMFLGYSILQVKKHNAEKVQPLINLINASKEVVLSMVRRILRLTPYGVFALMTRFMMTNSLFALAEIGRFVAASYAAIVAMYVIHVMMVGLFRLSPIQFVKKSLPVLVFGFGSRSSMAAIPLNIETQTGRLGVDEETANLSATFGASIGQNGCAGIYPAMLAIMSAQIMGVSIDFSFILYLLAVIAISSFGIAGVGGGATFAAIAVLTIMGLDIHIAAILISVEALIDMGRTALNISDSILSGLLTAKRNGTLDRQIYNSNDLVLSSSEKY